MEVRGRDGINGLPATVKVTSEDVRKALEEPLETLLGKIRSLLEKCPPELSADIVDNGIYLTGGGALLGGKRKRGSVYLWQTIRWTVWLTVPERRWTIWTSCAPVQYTATPCFKLKSFGTAMEASYCSASMPSC